MLFVVADGLRCALGEGGEGGKSGRRRGTRKRESPREPSSVRPVRASASATSLSVALENHLKPSSLYWGPYGEGCASGAGVAIVSVRETSDPPGRYTYTSLECDLNKKDPDANLCHPLSCSICMCGIATSSSQHASANDKTRLADLISRVYTSRCSAGEPTSSRTTTVSLNGDNKSPLDLPRATPSDMLIGQSVCAMSRFHGQLPAQLCFM